MALTKDIAPKQRDTGRIPLRRCLLVQSDSCGAVELKYLFDIKFVLPELCTAAMQVSPNGRVGPPFQED